MAQKRDNGLCPPFCLGENCPPATTLVPNTSVPPCMPLGPFKLLPWCWISVGVSLSKSICGFFKRDCVGSRSFFHQLNSHWFLQPEVMGTYLPDTGTLGWGALYGAITPHSQDIPPEFLSTTHGYGTNLFHISPPPSSLDGCDFFNSVVVRLPFNSTSDGFE